VRQRAPEPRGDNACAAAGSESSTMASEVSTAAPCAWRWAWTRGAELTSDRLHGVLCRENEGLESQSQSL